MIDSSPKRAKKHAFTLIELLVVIAIIVILMGLLFPVIGSVKESGRKVQAKNDLTSIVNSVKAYYTEYGKYPNPTNSTTDVAFGATTPNAALIDILRNTNVSVTGTFNPRSIVFLEAPSVKDPSSPKSGVLIANANTNSGEWYDPWGTVYNIAIDEDYDNQILKATHSYSDANFSTISTGVIGWSYGKDKKQGINGNKTYLNSDDVISWQ